MNSRLSIISSLICIIILSYLLVIFKVDQSKINRQANELTLELNKKKKELQKVKETQQRKFLKQARKSNNVNERTSAEQILASQELSTQANKFFEIVTTFDSQKDWLNREKKVQSLVTPNVLLNKSIFNNGLDNTGRSIIETTKSHASFKTATTQSAMVKDNQIEGIVHVVYEAWQDNHTSGIRTEVYQVKYSLLEHKFTDIQDLGMENQEADISYQK